jgi:hypothetical protein
MKQLRVAGSPSRDLNPGAPEYEARLSPTGPRHTDHQFTAAYADTCRRRRSDMHQTWSIIKCAHAFKS